MILYAATNFTCMKFGKTVYDAFTNKFYLSTYRRLGYAVSQLVEAPHYKPEGRKFDFLWGHWNFSVT